MAIKYIIDKGTNNCYPSKLIGLSTDVGTLPTTVAPGSTFIATDNSTVRMFNGTAWNLITATIVVNI